MYLSEEPLPDVTESSRTNLQWCTTHIQKSPKTMHCTHLTWRSHKTEDWNFFQTGSKCDYSVDTMPSGAMVRVVNLHRRIRRHNAFDTRPAQVTDVTRSSSSNGKEENPVQPIWKQHRRNPLRDDSDQAHFCCTDLRAQGEPEHLTDGEEQTKVHSVSRC